MRKRITKRVIDAVPATERDLFVWDTELTGFGVKITSAGKRIFVIQYSPKTLHNTRRRVTLGAYGPLTVEQARAIAARLLGRVAAGEDPAQERAEERRGVKERTVALLSEEYLEECRAKMAIRTAEEYTRLFRVYIIPALGRLPVAHVSVREVAHLHLEHRDRPIQANRVLQCVKSFLYWCERRGLTAPHSNPCRRVEPYPENVRERFLSVGELATLGAALRTAETLGLPPAPEHRRAHATPETLKHRPKNADAPAPANPFAVAAIRFLLFTGWREQEALTLRWDYVDAARGIATLPRTKTGRSIRPLGAPALELLDSLPRVHGSPYVFPGAKPDAPLTEIKRVWCAARYAAGLLDVRLHDLRHTVASMSVGTGHSLYLTGALLGHANSATTQRYAHLAVDARQAAADAVAGAMRAALDGTEGTEADVLPIRAAR